MKNLFRFVSALRLALLVSSAIFAAEALAANQKIVIGVRGMVCSFCAQGIQKKFGAEPGVVKVEPKLKEHQVVLEVREGEKLGDERISKLLEDSGYTVEKISREE